MGHDFKTLSHENTTLLVTGNRVQASYPRYMDCAISFDERLAEIKTESVRKALNTIMLDIQKEYIPGVHDKRDIALVEEDMVNYPQRFLYGLAELYDISNAYQRRDIIETLISSKVKYIEYL